MARQCFLSLFKIWVSSWEYLWTPLNNLCRRSVWQQAVPSTVLILLCLFPLPLSSDLFKMLPSTFFFFPCFFPLLRDSGYSLMRQAPVAISTEVKNNALFKHPIVTSRSYIYMNFSLKIPMSSKIHQHGPQTSRKYYQVDNLQDIFKLSYSFVMWLMKKCAKLCPKRMQTC